MATATVFFNENINPSQILVANSKVYIVYGGIGVNESAIKVYQDNGDMNQTPTTVNLSVTSSSTLHNSLGVSSGYYSDLMLYTYQRAPDDNNVQGEIARMTIYKVDDPTFNQDVNADEIIVQPTGGTPFEKKRPAGTLYFEANSQFIVLLQGHKGYYSTTVFVSAVDYTWSKQDSTDSIVSYVHISGSKIIGITSTNAAMTSALMSLCPTECAECLEDGTCTACESGYTLNGNECAKNDCSMLNNCDICNGDQSICYECAPGNYIDSGNQSQCNAHVDCTGNVANCESCIDANECYKCAPGYSIGAAGTSCVKNTCSGSNCNDCDANDDCVACANGFAVDPIDSK